MTRARESDACPGALHVHRAADGALARVRLPGGMLSAAQLAALARASSQFGSGTLELTARGNVQIRGIDDPATVADTIAATGLLPSVTHERVRNIVASPLSGRTGGCADVRGWISELDAAICANPALAGLPGRFWFSIDDGRCDVSGLGADLGVQVLGEGVALVVAGRDTGIRLPAAAAVPTLIDLAARFLVIREKAWRVTELADLNGLVPGSTPSGTPFIPLTRPPVGWITQDWPGQEGRISLGAAVPLGVLQAGVAECLAAIGAPLVITPFRSVLICDLDEGAAEAALRVLAPMGLVFDENSPWCTISACVGSPGCKYSAADVRADAAAAAQSADTTMQRRHFVGCERACGSPPSGEVLIATAEGYRVLRSRP